jgi:hypothetical protein
MGQFSINQKNRSELVSSIFTKTGRFLSIFNPWWVQVQLSSSAHGVFAYQNRFRFVPEYVENDWTLKQITFFLYWELEFKYQRKPLGYREKRQNRFGSFRFLQFTKNRSITIQNI